MPLLSFLAGNVTGVTLTLPTAIAVSSKGVVYVADTDNQAVRQITAGGVVSTWAGTPGKEGLQDGATKEATFSLPCGLAQISPLS